MWEVKWEFKVEGWTETEAWGFAGDSRPQGTNVQECNLHLKLESQGVSMFV